MRDRQHDIRNMLGGVAPRYALGKLYALSALDVFVRFIRKAFGAPEPEPRVVSIQGRKVLILRFGLAMPIPSGGDGTDEVLPTELAERLARAGDLNDEELEQLEGDLTAAFDEADGETPDVALMEAIAGAVDQVRAEGQKRIEAAEQAEAKAAEIRSRVHAVDDSKDEETDDADAPKAEAKDSEDDDGNGDSNDSDDDANDDATSDDSTATESTESTDSADDAEALAAAAPRRPSLAELNRRKKKSATPRPSIRVEERPRILAAAEIAGRSAGDEFKSMKEMGLAVFDKGRAALHSRQGGYFPVAKARWEYPDERTLHGQNERANTDRIESVVASIGKPDEGGALVAAGGLCAPVDVRYELYTLGDQRRPIRDALVRFMAPRGGIQFNQPPRLSTIAASDAVNRYTESQDEAGTDYPKGFYSIDCGDLVTREVAAIVARGRIGNFQRKFNVESWDANWDLILTQHARVAEDALWDSIEADSTAVVSGLDASTELGTARRVLRTIALAVKGLRDRHRIPENFPIRMLAPEWLRDNMREDIAAQLPGDDALAVADATINSYFAARGVAPTFSPDAGGQYTGAQAAGALNPWPDHAQVLMFPEGTHLFLDGGELNFGLEIRDASLNERNNVEAMTETFEETAPVGPESLSLTIDICASGRSSAAVAYDPCTQGS